MQFDYVGTVLTITGSGTLNSFDGYKEATKVIVKGTFTKIGENVFCDRPSLTEIILPDSIEYIDNHLFAYSSIKSFHIPLSLSSITGLQPFDQCPTLEEFTIDPNHQYYKVVDGVLFSKDMKTIVCYPGGKKGTLYSIPYGVEITFNAAIGYNEELKNIIIPSTLMQSAGFGYMNEFYNVTIFRCNGTNPDDKVYGNEDEYLFYTSRKFLNLSYKFTDYEYEMSGDEKILIVRPMRGCRYSRSKRIHFDDMRFSGHDRIEEVIFESGITSYNTECFNGCKNLKNIRFINNYKHIKTKCLCQRTNRLSLYLIIVVINK